VRRPLRAGHSLRQPEGTACPNPVTAPATNPPNATGRGAVFVEQRTRGNEVREPVSLGVLAENSRQSGPRVPGPRTDDTYNAFYRTSDMATKRMRLTS
jgi:hypothetical protein